MVGEAPGEAEGRQHLRGARWWGAGVSHESSWAYALGTLLPQRLCSRLEGLDHFPVGEFRAAEHRFPAPLPSSPGQRGETGANRAGLGDSWRAQRWEAVPLHRVGDWGVCECE